MERYFLSCLHFKKDFSKCWGYKLCYRKIIREMFVKRLLYFAVTRIHGSWQIIFKLVDNKWAKSSRNSIDGRFRFDFIRYLVEWKRIQYLKCVPCRPFRSVWGFSACRLAVPYLFASERASVERTFVWRRMSGEATVINCIHFQCLHWVDSEQWF